MQRKVFPFHSRISKLTPWDLTNFLLLGYLVFDNVAQANLILSHHQLWTSEKRNRSRVEESLFLVIVLGWMGCSDCNFASVVNFKDIIWPVLMLTLNVSIKVGCCASDFCKQSNTGFAHCSVLLILFGKIKPVVLAWSWPVLIKKKLPSRTFPRPSILRRNP